MILLRRCDVNAFNGIQPIISIEYEVHGTESGAYSINNVEKQLLVVYTVKKGDKLKYVDNGVDVYVQAIHLHQIGGNGSCTSGCHPAYTNQGFTGGSIIVDEGNGQKTVATYQGNGDTNLNYTVQ